MIVSPGARYLKHAFGWDICIAIPEISKLTTKQGICHSIQNKDLQLHSGQFY